MLGFTRWVIRIANGLNWLCGVLFAAVLALALFGPRTFLERLDAGLTAEGPAAWILVVAAIGLGLLAVIFVHMIFARVLALIDAANSAESFSEVNARRLIAIAWCLLAINAIDLAYGLLSFQAEGRTEGFFVGWFPSLTGWFAALLLFILARIFRHGAAMRADLEGTI